MKFLLKGGDEYVRKMTVVAMVGKRDILNV